MKYIYIFNETRKRNKRQGMQQHVNLAINKEMAEITDDKQGNRRRSDDSSPAITLGVFVKHVFFWRDF